MLSSVSILTTKLFFSKSKSWSLNFRYIDAINNNKQRAYNHALINTNFRYFSRKYFFLLFRFHLIWISKFSYHDLIYCFQENGRSIWDALQEVSRYGGKIRTKTRRSERELGKIGGPHSIEVIQCNILHLITIKHLCFSVMCQVERNAKQSNELWARKSEQPTNLCNHYLKV